MTIPRNDPRGIYTYEKGLHKIEGSVQIIAGAPVQPGQHVGDGFTLTRTGVGDYLITLDRAFTGPIIGVASIQAAAANVDLYCQWGTITPGAAPTLQLRTKTIGAVADLTANDWIHFKINCRDNWIDAGATPRHDPEGFWTYERGELVEVQGRIEIAAGPVVGPVQGEGFAVTRNGNGDYTVTFNDGFTRLYGVQATMETSSGAGVDMYVQPAVFTPGAGAAASLQLLAKTGAANAPIAAGDAMHFMALLYSEGLEGY